MEFPILTNYVMERYLFCACSVSFPKFLKRWRSTRWLREKWTGSLASWVWCPGHTLWKKSSCKSVSNSHIYVKVTPLWMCMCVCVCVKWKKKHKSQKITSRTNIQWNLKCLWNTYHLRSSMGDAEITTKH